MRRRSFRSARRKRSVAWIPGLTSYDTAGATPLNRRIINLDSLSAGAPDTFGAAVQMTTDTDLGLHGGEDAVLTRIRGRLFFSDGRVNSGAGFAATSFQLRVVLCQQNITPAGATMPMDFTTSDGLGNDTILWFSDVIVVSTVTTGVTGLDLIDWQGRSLDIDCKAKRKLSSDNPLILWFQTVFDVASVTDVDFTLRGGLRMLMMRPR